jgi:hypothetical protein
MSREQRMSSGCALAATFGDDVVDPKNFFCFVSEQPHGDSWPHFGSPDPGHSKRNLERALRSWHAR